MILSAFPFFCESPCACVRHSSRYVFCSYLVLLEPYSMVKNQDCYRYVCMYVCIYSIRGFPQGPTGIYCTTCTLLLWWPTQDLCALFFSFSKDLLTKHAPCLLTRSLYLQYRGKHRELQPYLQYCIYSITR